MRSLGSFARFELLRSQKPPRSPADTSLQHTSRGRLGSHHHGTTRADMTISETIEFTPVEDLSLDPQNPRLRNDERGSSQAELLEIMKGWGLEEVAASIVHNGFWPYEAVFVVREKLGRKKELVVVEGNRRLAAVKLLLRARDGLESPRWKALAGDLSEDDANKLRRVPTIRAGSREELNFYLGFRHVTGIKQWEPHEKAEFIAKLVDSGMSFEEVMRRIGSKTGTVRQNYIARNLFKQLSELEEVSAERVRDKFSVLYLSLRSEGTQKYLGVDLGADKKIAASPLRPKFHQNAVRFSRWLFGDDKHEPIITDSRFVDRFGTVLGSPEARAYLERTDNPKFEIAERHSGGDRIELIRHIDRAADEVREALGVVHLFVKHQDVVQAIQRLLKDVEALGKQVPNASDHSTGS